MGRVMMRFICLHGIETFRRKWNELKIGILIFRGHDVTLLLVRSKEKLVYLLYNKITLYPNQFEKLC